MIYTVPFFSRRLERPTDRRGHRFQHNLTILGPVLYRGRKFSVVQFLYQGLYKLVTLCFFPKHCCCSTVGQHEEKQVASSLEACFVAGYPLDVAKYMVLRAPVVLYSMQAGNRVGMLGTKVNLIEKTVACYCISSGLKYAYVVVVVMIAS